MSQNKLAKLRNTDVFKALMRVLDEYRIPKEDFDVLDKRPHPMLTVRYCGVEREMSIPSTPKTKGKAPVAYSGQLRRLLKEMQMSALGDSVSHEQVEHQMQEEPMSPLFVVKTHKTALQENAFDFEGTNVRVVLRNEEPWFVARDVCACLDTANASQTLQALDDDEKGICSIYTLGGEQDLLTVSEGGLYTLVLRSRLATTPGSVPHRFRRWVTHNVLPQIRRTGEYRPAPAAVPTTAEAFAHAFTMLAESERRHAETERRQLEQAQELSHLRDKVDRVETAQTVMRARPSGAESITHIRERIGRLHGLSATVIDEVIRQSPYSPKPAGMVRNDHVDADGALYAVYWQKDITSTFNRFVAEATQVSPQLFTHPFIFGRFRIGSRVGAGEVAK